MRIENGTYRVGPSELKNPSVEYNFRVWEQADINTHRSEILMLANERQKFLDQCLARSSDKERLGHREEVSTD